MNSRQKVLFVTRKWPPAIGGMELYSRELTAAMSNLASVEILALPGREDGRPPSPVELFIFVVRALIHLTLRARRYNLVHFGDFVLIPLAVWTRPVAPKTTIFLTVHGLDLLYARRSGWKSRLYRLYVNCARPFFGCVSLFIANSRATAKVAAEFGIKHVVPIPLGVSIDPTAGTGDVDDQPYDRGDATSSGRYVLFVGRIVPRKGVAWFAENVLDRLPSDVTFKIAGAPWDEDELARALRRPRVEYLGQVSDKDLASLRRGAALAVMPNRHLADSDIEGFGLVALETAARGTLLAASATDGIVDAVIDGKTGFLIAEGDADAWVAKVTELLSWTGTQRHEFLREARKIIASQYSWERVARDTLELANKNHAT